jgi:hypothetical protein
MNDWTLWLAPEAFLALLGIGAIVWKGVRLIFKVEAALPVLFEISHEFSPNSGNSLRDQIDAVRVDQRAVAGNLVKQVDSMQSHIAADATAFAKQDQTNLRVEATLDRIEDHVRGKQ